MNSTDIYSRLKFIKKAEPLKDTLRSAHTSCGKQESAAEHTWRLTLLAITYADYFPDADHLKLLKICILHDLGEVVGGDIPAPQQSSSKSEGEREDFVSLLSDLPQHVQTQFTQLWDEYEASQTQEAKIAKALDKIETLLQHNQGKNPANFDYAFNLDYGRKNTDAIELARELRVSIDNDTTARSIEQPAQAGYNTNCVDLKAFIPAADYSKSKAFYQEIGFSMASDQGGIAFFSIGCCNFLLQQVDQPPESPPMMHLQVEDVDAWHQCLTEKKIAEQFATDITDIVTQPWAMREFLISDPCGVTWRFAQNTTLPSG